MACVWSGTGGELCAVDTWLRLLTTLALMFVVSIPTAAAPVAVSAPSGALVTVLVTETLVG
jgi:hypothetical protein